MLDTSSGSGPFFSTRSGTGAGVTVKEMIAAAQRVMGVPVPYSVGPRRAGDLGATNDMLVRSAEIQCGAQAATRRRRQDTEQLPGVGRQAFVAQRLAHPAGVDAHRHITQIDTLLRGRRRGGKNQGKEEARKCFHE